MLDIGWTELLLIGVVALIVVGPRDLPKLFHSLGRITAKARGMAREFSSAMEDAAKGSGLDEAAGTLRDVKNMTSKRALGLDALDRAAERFEKWDPKRPLSSHGADAAKGAAGSRQAVPDPAAPAAVADAAIKAPAGAATSPAPLSAEPFAASPASSPEMASQNPASRRRLHAVRRSDTKDQ